jgi:hypothetical protein
MDEGRGSVGRSSRGVRAAKLLPLMGMLVLATRAAALPDPQWVPFRSPEGRFSIEMPGAPKSQERLQGDIVVKIVQVTEGMAGAFSLSYNDLPAVGAAAPTLAQVLDQIGGMGKEVGPRKPITVQGYPGVETEFQIQGARVWYKVVLVGKRLYQMNVLGQGPTQSSYPPRMRRFFDSFQIIRAGSAPR